MTVLNVSWVFLTIIIGVTQRKKTRLTILKVAYYRLKTDTILKEIEHLELKVHKNTFFSITL